MKLSIQIALSCLFAWFWGTGCSASISENASSGPAVAVNAASVSIDELIPSFCGQGSCEKIYFGNVWLVAGSLPKISWNMDETLWFADCLVSDNAIFPSGKRQILFYFTTLDSESKVDVFKSFFGVGNRRILLRSGVSRSREKLSDSEWSPWKESSISRLTMTERKADENPLCTKSSVTLEFDGNSLTIPYMNVESAIETLLHSP